MRISRRLRGFIAAAVTTGALLVLPGAAFAAPTVSVVVTKDASTPSIEPGAVVKYNVVVTNTDAAAVTGDGDVLTVSVSEGGTVAGGVVIADAQTGTDISVFADGTAGKRTFTVPAGFNNSGSQTLQFDVTLPPTHKLIADGDPVFVKVTNGTIDADVNAALIDTNSASTDVYKGDPTKTSKLFTVAGATTSAPAGLTNWWAPKDSTTMTTFTITNWGDGPAYNVVVNTFASYSTSSLNPEKPKAGAADFSFETDFNPLTAIGAGSDCGDFAATASTTDCVIGEIPAGGSKTVNVNVTGLTHLGASGRPIAQLDNFSYVHEKSRQVQDPSWNGTDDFRATVSAANVTVTDGKSVLPQVDIDGPTTGAGRADLSYAIEITNGGPDSITGGMLRVESTVFDDKGNPAFGDYYTDATARVASLKSVTLSNGAVCVPAQDFTVANFVTGKFDTKAFLSKMDCPIADLPSGARLTGTAVANFPTGHKDSTVAGDPQNIGDAESGSVTAQIFTAQFAKPGSRTVAGDGTRLNRTASADLDVSVKSAKDIGADRLGLHTVTIKNNGPSTAKNVSLDGQLYKLVGKFEPTLLPGACTGVVVSSRVSCAIGDIESGKSVDITISVLGPSKVGSQLVTTYSVGSAEWDTNQDNDSVAHVQNVVKASLAPLAGVTVAKIPAVLKVGTFVKPGLKSVVTVSGPSVIVVDVQVSAPVAKTLGLIKKGKAKAPAFIKIGTAKKVMKAGGKATVFTKLSAKYKAKVLKYKKPFKAQRVVTVTSTATLTKGATSLTTSNLTIKK